MFNRYWRTYPWGLQVFLFLMTWFTLMSFGSYLVLTLVPKFTGYPINELLKISPDSPARAIRSSLLMQAISHAFTFGAPALIFAGFAHPRLREYLGLRSPGKGIQWLLVTGIMLGLAPVIVWGEAWAQQYMHFGKWAEKAQVQGEVITKAFLSLGSGTDLVLLLSILALLPALGEELLFRGVFLRLLHRRASRSVLSAEPGKPRPEAQQVMILPIVTTALFFTLWHFQNPNGFVFIFIAGCVLGLIYFLTGSLLCSIWGHLIYNGMQVIVLFVSHSNSSVRKVVEAKNLPVIYPIIGLLVFGLCFYLLVKSQTPLPPDWSDDFKGEALPTKDNS